MKSKLIVALVYVTRDVVDVFKVGRQLFTRVGPQIVESFHGTGQGMFSQFEVP
ncbi:MAG: hypothetical protein ACLP0A_16130 [Verrucomicrobiia bacterium]